MVAYWRIAYHLPCKMKKKIAFVVTYFGELPFYFAAFQLSCKYNPDVQWLIFSDCDEPPNLPVNITFIRISIKDFESLATEKLGYQITIDPDYLYKICDFKPAFGAIYADYLQEYSFWGHCDIDIVWGQINRFIDSLILENYDLITSRIKRVSGHFCLYRNTQKINSLFLSMPVTEKCLKKSGSCERLDEIHFTNYLHNQLRPGLIRRISQIGKAKPSIPRVYWKKVLTTSGKHQRELYRSEGNCFKWKKGRVYHCDGEEMMYIHFHKLKDTLKKIYFSYSDNPEEFIVTAREISVSRPL